MPETSRRPLLPASSVPASENRSLEIILSDGFSMLTLSVVVELLSKGNTRERTRKYSWRFTSVDGLPVASEIGTSPVLDGTLGQCPRGAALLVLGAETEPARSRKLSAHIRQQWREGRKIIAIDRGVFAIAEAGILAGHSFTVHQDFRTEFDFRHPGLSPSGAAFEVDKRISTCAGGFAVADMVLTMMEDDLGKATRSAVEDNVLFISLYKPGTPATCTPLRTLTRDNPVLARAIEIIAERLDEPDILKSLTSELGISRRQLERYFSSILATTPKKFLTELRLEKAARLLTIAQTSALSVAFECGFGSQSTFTKAFKRKYGVAPKNYC
ncbi:GlxA family transcriptional regulator [Roseibium sp. SCP14]|uniref:GlxA family transcriptional regulator n=1 Tax=Roseibium sp. SCP14 TaxID=3141375 RepID=UPI00333A03D9